jgi:hypothetical protein
LSNPPRGLISQRRTDGNSPVMMLLRGFFLLQIASSQNNYKGDKMPYITVKQQPVYRQMSFEDIIAGIDDLSKYVHHNITNTRTYYVEKPNAKLLENTKTVYMIDVLKRFNQTHENLFNADRASLYHSFHIPKNSGGLRRIDAPQPELRHCHCVFSTEDFHRERP